MHLLAFAQILFINAIEELMANLRGNRLDSLNKRTRRSTKRNQFGATITGRRLAVDEPLGFETVQQPRQCRPLNRNALRKLTLCRVVIEPGQMQQHQPSSLRKIEICQTTVQLGAPATRKLSQLHGEAVLVGIHGAVFPEKLIISELITAPEDWQGYHRLGYVTQCCGAPR
ncbi:hypothetical protein PSEUDO9AG_41246 [Pseudomonas sp. 9Ag]|nr:hypothetical protein PSEUDO9AG_41246 [Pseudomonas sp. 9Ag]